MKDRRVEGRKKSLNQDLQDYGITTITNFPAAGVYLLEGRHPIIPIFHHSNIPINN